MTKVEQCASKAELRDKLRRFYPTVNPAKLGDVDSLVERYFLRQPDLNTLLKGLYVHTCMCPFAASVYTQCSAASPPMSIHAPSRVHQKNL